VPACSFLSSAWRTRIAAVGEERGEHWSEGSRQSRGPRLHHKTRVVCKHILKGAPE
jgi:hypothetical protein